MRCAARRRTAAVTQSLRRREAGGWRCAGCCWKSPTCCCSTSRPTISMPRASPGWKSTLRDYAGTVLVVTHDRYFLENVTNWILEIERGRGYPFEGNYSSWLRAEAQAAAAGGEGGERATARRWRPSQEWISVERRGRRQTKSKARIAKYEDMLAKSRRRWSAAWPRSSSRPGRGWAAPSSRRRSCARATATIGAHRRAELQAAAGRHRRRDRAERRRQVDIVQNDHRTVEHARFGGKLKSSARR